MVRREKAKMQRKKETRLAWQKRQHEKYLQRIQPLTLYLLRTLYFVRSTSITIVDDDRIKQRRGGGDDVGDG